MTIEESERVRVTVLMSKTGRDRLKELAKIFSCPQYEVIDAIARVIEPSDERFQDMVAERIEEMPFVMQRWLMMKNLSSDPKFASFVRKGHKEGDEDGTA